MMSTIEPFSRGSVGQTGFVSRIGSGALGGKANGLILARNVLENRSEGSKCGVVPVSVPWMTILGTDLFDEFMEQNQLQALVESDASDERIAHEFQQADLPAQLVGDLRSLASTVHVPLAIRSSSLLEDALYRPFAGVYATKMVPNNQPSADARFRKLTEAVKLVYASTFFRAAKDYRQAIGEDLEDEKMAVIIQEVVGTRYGDRFYPTFSGVARSFNYYPFGHAEVLDGVVDLALGLGKTIVDGGYTWSYCPKYPKSPPPYNNIKTLISNSQTDFFAVNMGRPEAYNPLKETEYLEKPSLADAEYDDTLKHVCSTFDTASNRIIPGVGRNGPRVVDFAPLLTLNEFPVNDAVLEVLELFKQETNNHVEIEFAVNIDEQEKDKARFGFLQVRPLAGTSETFDVPWGLLESEQTLIASTRVLGNVDRNDIRDIVYVRPEAFEPKFTGRIASELEGVNRDLAGRNRPYVLIGFGRFGTSDPWYGIPATWDQLSFARVIVEADLKGFSANMSQGSHFFHNLTSFKVCYFSVPKEGECRVDFNRLNGMKATVETENIRHIEMPAPLSVRVDGRIGRGVVMCHD